MFRKNREQGIKERKASGAEHENGTDQGQITY